MKFFRRNCFKNTYNYETLPQEFFKKYLYYYTLLTIDTDVNIGCWHDLILTIKISFSCYSFKLQHLNWVEVSKKKTKKKNKKNRRGLGNLMQLYFNNIDSRVLFQKYLKDYSGFFYIHVAWLMELQYFVNWLWFECNIMMRWWEYDAPHLNTTFSHGLKIMTPKLRIWFTAIVKTIV